MTVNAIFLRKVRLLIPTAPHNAAAATEWWIEFSPAHLYLQQK